MPLGIHLADLQHLLPRQLILFYPGCLANPYPFLGAEATPSPVLGSPSSILARNHLWFP